MNVTERDALLAGAEALEHRASRAAILMRNAAADEPGHALVERWRASAIILRVLAEVHPR